MYAICIVRGVENSPKVPNTVLMIRSQRPRLNRRLESRESKIYDGKLVKMNAVAQ